MTLPVKGKPLILYVSTLKETIGNLLAKEDLNGNSNAIYYLSRTLIDGDTKYVLLRSYVYICITLVLSQNNKLNFLRSL